MMKLDQVVALQIEGSSFSLAGVLRFAHMNGGFGALEDYASNVLIDAYAREHGLAAGHEELQEAVNEWRSEHGLYQASEVREWLADRSLSASDLSEYARMKIAKNLVRAHVAAGRVERYFAERRSAFDAATISQIVVEDRGIARELAFKAQEGTPFYELARAYSTDAATRLAGGYVGRRERAQLPRAIAELAFGPHAGAVVGPIAIDKRFYVIKIEEAYPAELNADTRARIEWLLFDEWLTDRRRQAGVLIALWGQDRVDGDTGHDKRE